MILNYTRSHEVHTSQQSNLVLYKKKHIIIIVNYLDSGVGWTRLLLNLFINHAQLAHKQDRPLNSLFHKKMLDTFNFKSWWCFTRLIWSGVIREHLDYVSQNMYIANIQVQHSLMVNNLFGKKYGSLSQLKEKSSLQRNDPCMTTGRIIRSTTAGPPGLVLWTTRSGYS
jgi:hypothetical protein